MFHCSDRVSFLRKGICLHDILKEGVMIGRPVTYNSYEVWLIPTSHPTESQSQLGPSIRSTNEISKSLAQRSVCERPSPYIVHRSFNTSVSHAEANGEGEGGGFRLNLAMRLTVRGNQKYRVVCIHQTCYLSKVNFLICVTFNNPANFRNMQMFTNPLRFLEHVIVFIMN